MKARKGMILPVVLLLICILLLLAGTRHFFSQHQLTQASHGADYEKAYHLATGGLESVDTLLMKAVNFINDGRSESFPKVDKAPPELKLIIKEMLGPDGLIDLDNKKIPIESDLFKYLQKDFEDYSSLKVELELRKLENLFAPSGTPGPIPDEREAKAMVLLHAEASVNGAFARVYRYREAKLVNILPPVLGKFVLFLREQGGANVNTLADSIIGKNQVSDSPLMVHSGTGCSPAALPPDESASFFDRQGWVFLGSEAPWKLGAGPGGGDDEYASSMVSNDLRVFSIPDTDALSARADISYYSQPEYLFKELREPFYREVMQESASDDLQSARIRIAGSASRPAPTVVLGKAINRWLLLQGLKNERTGLYAPLPNIGEPQFLTDHWPGMTAAAARRVRDNFGGDFRRYRERMTSIVEESCNAANLRALAFHDPRISWQIALNPGNLPAGIDLPVGSARASVDNRPVSFFEMNHGSLYRLAGSDGRQLFAGNLSGFEDIEYLKARAGYKFDSAADFYKAIQTDKKEFIIKDVYHIMGDLTIDRPLLAESGCGGMILVDGNVTISDAINAPDLEPVTIVSFGGSVRVSTSQPLTAALIALKNSVIIESAADINGMIAARDLAMNRLANLQKRSLSYNQNLDVTDAETCSRAFRLFMKPLGVTFVR
ncbi:MAG: hypothetical protein GQF41_0759 [Candidatus Rifleibacterium amylolyticum]|nr:MAG: hypothetical protein GQF41_0759 [Candidatus Rifleibacterium amylolyticum]